MKRTTSLLLLVLAGCGDPSKDPGTLALVLDSAEAGAGTAVPVRLVFSEGGASREVEGIVRSEQEAALAYADGAIVPTLAALHALTAIADVDGESFSATGQLLVLPGPAAALDLALDADAVVAGGTVAWTLSGADAYGNPVPLDAARVEGGDELTVEGAGSAGTVGGTVAGVHTLTASLEDAVDTATLAVTAGAPVSLELDVVADERSAVANVSILDGYGNSVDTDWELACEGACSCPTAPAIPFDTEGLCTVTASVADAGLSDTYGPFVVDWSGPALSVESPARAEWFDVGVVTVHGTAPDAGHGLASVTVNGVPATLSGDAWSVDVDLPFGPTILETVAVDAAGNTSTDVRSVIAGERQPFADPSRDALVFRLAEGEGGLDILGEMSAESTSARVISSSLPSPLLDVADQECTTAWGVRFCVDYSIEAEVSEVRWGDVDVVYDPQADGTLVVDVIFTDVELPWTASGELAGVPYADSGTGTADELTVSLVFEFSVVSDVIEVDIRDVEVSTTAFDLGLSSDVDSVASYLGVDFEAEARAALEDAVEANLVEDLEAGLEAAFADLAVSESFPVGETTSRVSLTPTSVEVDADGLDVHMAFAVSLEEWMIDSADGGTLYDDHGQPTWSSLSRGAAMALSATGANLLLYARWGGGVFNRSLSIDDLFEVDVTTFSAIFPGVSDPVLVVDSEAPPMIVPLEDGGTLFAFPEMRLDIYDGEATPGAEVYTLYMSILSDSTFFLGEDMIDIDWGRPTAYVDIVVGPEELTPEDTESLQTILESLVSGLLLDENSHLGGLYLPVINGYGLEATGIFSDGADHGYVVAEGDFEAL